MLMKICTKCGKRLPKGKKCSCTTSRHKMYNKTVRDKEKNEFYHSAQWRSIVGLVKARANGLDEYALSLGMILKGNTVHHIYTVDERPDLKLSVDNLIYVSAKIHNQLHAEYNESPERKRDLQIKLLKIITE